MKNIEFIKEDLKKSIGDKLYNHCINVMDTAEDLADFYNISKDKAKIAGLLHDCGKLPNKSIGSLEHASLGSKIANEKYEVKDKEILDAISYHTTGRENMTMLDKIIYIADKIEPNRKYDGVEKLRDLAYKDIDESIIKSLDNTFEHLKSKDKEIDSQSYKTYEFLINRKK